MEIRMFMKRFVQGSRRAPLSSRMTLFRLSSPMMLPTRGSTDCSTKRVLYMILTHYLIQNSSISQPATRVPSFLRCHGEPALLSPGHQPSRQGTQGTSPSPVRYRSYPAAHKRLYRKLEPNHVQRICCPTTNRLGLYRLDPWRPQEVQHAVPRIAATDRRCTSTEGTTILHVFRSKLNGNRYPNCRLYYENIICVLHSDGKSHQLLHDVASPRNHSLSLDRIHSSLRSQWHTYIRKGVRVIVFHFLHTGQYNNSIINYIQEILDFHNIP